MSTRRIPLLIPALVLALAAWTFADTAPTLLSGPLLGFSDDHASEQRALEARFDSPLDAANLREWMKRLSARSAPRRLSLRQGERRVHGGPLPLLGVPDRDRAVQGPLPDARRRACLEMVAPTRFTATLAEPPVPEDSTSGQTAEQLPTYNAYSIDGDVTGELVYVNYGVPEDYEELERARHRRQGQDRHRPLRRLLARHQAQGGRRARRHRLHHLLRSSRGRLLPGRRLPQGRLALRAQRPARLGGRHAHLLGRSADPRRGRDRGRQAARRQGRAHADQDPRAADLLRRRPAAAPGAGRPDGARRSGAAPCRSPTTSAPARPRSTSSWSSTGSWSPIYDVIARLPGAERPDQWVDPRQPPRRLGQRRHRPDQRHGGRDGGGPRRGRARQDGLAAQAHHRLRRLGRRGAGPARLDRVGRDPRRRAAREGRRLHQLRRQLPRLPRRRRLAHAGEPSSTRSPAT